MNKRNKIFFVTFFLIAILIAILVFVNYDFFNKIIIDNVLKYGLIGIFILSLIADLFEQPFGPEVSASIGVLLGLNVFFIFLVSCLGSWIGSYVNFYIGKEILSQKIRSVCSTKKHANHCKLFSKYGKLSVFLAAISPIPWVFFCWLSGAFYMKKKDFFVWGLLPRAFRIGFVILLVSLVV